jgi:hypothetical protein
VGDRGGAAVLGLVNDAYFRFLGDMGNFGPDRGKRGRYLLVSESHKGAVPKGYYVLKTRTHNNVVIIRSFLEKGDLAGSVKTQKEKTRIYPLSAAANPPAQKFVNISGLKFNTVHASDFKFYEDVLVLPQDLDPLAGGERIQRRVSIGERQPGEEGFEQPIPVVGDVGPGMEDRDHRLRQGRPRARSTDPRW